MRVTYKPQRRSTCTALAANYDAATCLHVDGASLETVIVDAFFQALAPAELNLLQEVLAAQQADADRVAKLRAEQLARAEYEAGLAQRHYQAVDSANRLVAAELERRWEVTLQAVAEAREEMEHMVSQPQLPELTEATKAQLQDVGRYLPTMWASGRLKPAHQKDILRSLIRRIIVTRPTPDTVEARVVWISGAVTLFSVHPPIARGSDVSGYEQLVERILTLGAQGYQDPEIRSGDRSRPLVQPRSLGTGGTGS